VIKVYFHTLDGLTSEGEYMDYTHRSLPPFFEREAFDRRGLCKGIVMRTLDQLPEHPLYTRRRYVLDTGRLDKALNRADYFEESDK
jgi:hypothetical protein